DILFATLFASVSVENSVCYSAKALFKNKLIIRLTLQATAFRVPALAGSGGVSRTTNGGCAAKAAAAAWRGGTEPRRSPAATSNHVIIGHGPLITEPELKPLS